MSLGIVSHHHFILTAQMSLTRLVTSFFLGVAHPVRTLPLSHTHLASLYSKQRAVVKEIELNFHLLTHSFLEVLKFTNTGGRSCKEVLPQLSFASILAAHTPRLNSVEFLVCIVFFEAQWKYNRLNPAIEK